MLGLPSRSLKRSERAPQNHGANIIPGGKKVYLLIFIRLFRFSRMFNRSGIFQPVSMPSAMDD